MQETLLITLVILLVLAYAAEAVIGWLLGVQRERKRLQENGG